MSILEHPEAKADVTICEQVCGACGGWGNTDVGYDSLGHGIAGRCSACGGTGRVLVQVPRVPVKAFR